jgi:hypothetical protein
MIDGTILPNHARVLTNHTHDTDGAIEIFSRRFDVDRVNNREINNLVTPAIFYRCEDFFLWMAHHRTDTTLKKYTERLPDNTLKALVCQHHLSQLPYTDPKE